MLNIYSKQNTRWAMAIGYVVFIFSTLSVVGIPISVLRQHNMLRISLAILYVIGFFVLLGLLIKKHPRKPWHYAAFSIIYVSYLFFARKIRIPEEQIHFFEYGLVGIFFARALRLQMKNLVKIFLASLFLATLSGIIDEFLQGVTPGRHYDLHDIWLNILSSSLGLLIYISFPHENNP